MHKAIEKIVEYCNRNWEGKFSAKTLEEMIDEVEKSIEESDRTYIDHVVLELLKGLAEDSMNGSTEAETYYEAIMDYIMAA